MASRMAVAHKKKQPIKRRESFFGQQVIRLMTKTCTANELGATACWLLSVVAATQDAAGGRAVTFYTNQIMPLIGVHKWDTLDAIRKRCVEAGWLEYRSPEKGERKPGLYKVVIPNRFAHLSDSRCDEGSNQYPENGERIGGSEYPENGYRDGERMGERTGYRIGERMGEPPSSPSTSPSTSNTPYPLSGFSQAFDMAWRIWPASRRTKRETSQSAWRDAVVRLAFRFDGDHRKAEDWIHQRVRAFCDSPKASGQFCPGIANWLIDGRYDDAPESWQESGEDTAPQSSYGEIAPV